MKNFIKRLRAKPEKERQQIIHFSTLVCGILLFTLWTFTLGQSFRSPTLKADVQRDLEPFVGLQANVIDGYNVISSSKE